MTSEHGFGAVPSAPEHAAAFCGQEGWGPLSPRRAFDFTPCFEDALITTVPKLALVMVGLLHLLRLRQRAAYPDAQKTRHYQAKMFFASGFLLVSGANFVVASVTPTEPGSWPTFSHVVFADFATFVCSCVVLPLTSVEHKKSRTASTTLLLFWLAMVVTGIVKLRTLVQLAVPSSRTPEFALFVATLMIAIVAFALEVKHKDPSLFIEIGRDYFDITDCPEDSANVFSRITFTWMSPLMQLGSKKPLTVDDLWVLQASNQSRNISDKFQQAWNAQLRKQVEGRGRASLVMACAQAFGGPIAFAGIYKICKDFLAFIQPQLLRTLMGFVVSYSKNEAEPPLYGYAIAVSMLLTSVCETAILHQYFQLCFVTGMRLRAALITAIYQKALRLSTGGRQKATIGEIVNHMSVDAQRIMDLCTYLHICWSGPLQIILAMTFLYRAIGPAVIAGVAIMILAIPLNAVLASRQRRLQKFQMANKDIRMKLMDEILNGIKVIKLYAYEESFLKKVTHVRNNKELATLKRIGYMASVQSFTWACTPFLVSFASFGVYAATGHQLTPQLVFVSLSLFNLLQFPMTLTPSVISSMVESSVAINRLYEFFTAEELSSGAVQRLPLPDGPGAESVPLVEISNGEFRWSPTFGEPTLTGVNFQLRSGQLMTVVGRVGSGKTSLLGAILGDLYKISGTVTVRGKVAYSSQAPWIMNSTLRENILFGHKFDLEIYNATLEACSLRQDLEVLPGGDMCEIGERGINLSGGQKARISLARAVYARADVYLLDDPLSAVDAHVGRHIFENVIGPKGLLRNRTRVFVTHQIHHLSRSDTIIMLRAGQVIAQGRFQEIMKERGALHALVTEYDASRREVRQSENSLDNDGEGGPGMGESLSSLGISETRGKRESSVQVESGATDNNEEDVSLERFNSPFGSKATLVEETDRRKDQAAQLKVSDPNHRIIQQEVSAVGKVDWRVYKTYAECCSITAVILYLLLIVGSQAASVGSNVFLKHWADSTTQSRNVWKYIAAYGGLGLLFGVFTISTTIVLWVFCAIRAASILHRHMLVSVMRSPMSFFDTTPMGRIINRFSKDVSTVDEIIPRSFASYFNTVFKIASVIIVISSSTPIFIFAVIPMAFMYGYIQRYYIATSRELKRLDSASRSPIYAHFQETLSGVSTIRAYAQQQRFILENEWRLDANQKAYYPSISANRWLAVRLEFIGSLVIFGASLLAVVTLHSRGNIDAGVVGLSVSYALSVTQTLNWMVRQSSEVESNIVSVERMKEYVDLPSEAPTIIEHNRPPAHWPTEGHIRFQDYQVRYRPGLELALKGITLDIQPGKKIGIVGRTGAGKSSLTLALFRLLEPAEGAIFVDGIDVSTIGLYDLRSRLTIIPQDPVIFAGTVRENVDPASQHDDTDIWMALEGSYLSDHVQRMVGGLDAQIVQGGENLSMGQRQLLALARALLRHTKILFMDEASSACDIETDDLIQKSIRNAFKGCTILTIAHRIKTVMDNDMMVVLENGSIAEQGTPKELLGNPKSIFYSLAKEAGQIHSLADGSSSRRPPGGNPSAA